MPGVLQRLERGLGSACLGGPTQEAPDPTPHTGLKSKGETHKLQDGMERAFKVGDDDMHSLHVALRKTLSGQKLPSSTFHAKLQPLTGFESHSLPLFFLDQRLLCSLPNNLGLVLIFHLGCLKCSRETVLPFRNSKYTHGPLLFFKVAGIFLGNDLNLSRCFAFHVSYFENEFR